VWAVLNNSEQRVVAQFASSKFAPILTALAGEFDLPPETITSGKIVTALKLMGFDIVLDAGYFTDLSVNEKRRELLERIKNSSNLPMIDSCFPGFIKFVKEFYPGLLDHLPAGKSSQQIFGAFVKDNYPKVLGTDRSKITTVSIMPCIAKKYETNSDVDFVLTAGELARMIRLAGIELRDLPESPYDSVTHNGAEVDLDGTKVKVLTVNGLANARNVMDVISKGECNAAFVEIVNCTADDGCAANDGCIVKGASRT
jgi:iron only hydrogenase large subunit-like protein